MLEGFRLSVVVISLIFCVGLVGCGSVGILNLVNVVVFLWRMIVYWIGLIFCFRIIMVFCFLEMFLKCFIVRRIVVLMVG